MVYENKLGGVFGNLAQRIIYPYIVSYPEFAPIESGDVSEKAQKQIYDFLKKTLIAIYKNPGIIEMPIEKDNCFESGVLYNTNPELNNSMKKQEKKFLGFFNFLFELGLYGDVLNNKLVIPKSKKAVSKNTKIILEQLGISCEIEKEETIVYSNEYPELCIGWRILSKTSGSGNNGDVIGQSPARLMFMKCLLINEPVPASRLYGSLEQSGKYLKQLEDFLIKKGYVYDLHDGKYTLIKHCPGNKDGKFKVLFDWQRKYQLNFYFEVPGFTTLVSDHYNDMD
ncbi:MAG: hypothetical protein LBH43_06015, partial [Treponema sp.]|nr:hypothetical protein [Treponema sp.]